jgi:CHAT domain-containing protein/Flp pilus assembly protein TadD
VGRRFLPAAGIVLAALAVGGAAVASLRGSVDPGGGAEAPSDEALQAGAVFERVLALTAGSYAEIVVEQIEGDVAVEVLDPRGRVVAVSDLPGRPWLDEIVLAPAAAGGDYVLRVRDAGDDAARGSRFRLFPVAEHPGRPSDAAQEGLGLWRAAAAARERQTEGDLLAAVDSLQRASELLADGDLPAVEARVLRQLASCHSLLGEVDAAETRYRRALALLEGTGQVGPIARVLNDLADLLTNRGDGDEAEPLYERALALARDSRDRRIEAPTWNNLGVLYYLRGELERGVEAFERALDLEIETQDDHERANTLANLGSVYRTLGRYADALRVSESALELARGLGDRERELRILNGRGVCFKAVGDLRSAAEAYRRALALVELLGARDMEATVSGNLGTLYRLLGQEDRARDYLGRALEAANEAGSVADQSWVLLARAELEREAGDESANAYYLEAKEKSEAGGDNLSTAHSLLGLGRAQLDQGRVVEAVPALQAALDLQVEISDRPGQVTTLRELGRAMVKLGRLPEARDDFRRSLDLAQLVGEPSKEAESRLRWAELLAQQGDLEEARGQATMALATLETLRRSLAEPDLRAGLQSRSQEDFAMLVDILARLDATSPGRGYAEEAFEVAERARARTLVELLTEAQADLARTLPADVATRRDNLSGRLSRTQKQLTSEFRQPVVDETRVAALKVEIQDLDRQRGDLERDIRLDNPRWAALDYPTPIDAHRTQQLLAPGQALVSFVLGARASYVFVVARDGLSIRSLPAEGVLSPLIGEFRELLATPGRRSLGRLKVVGAQLYDMLLGPVDSELRASDQLIIVADGPLNYVPFEALVQGDPSAGASGFVIARWAISYVPSASTIDVLSRRSHPSTDRQWQLAAFADPAIEGARSPDPGDQVLRGLGDRENWNWNTLRGARREVGAISELFDPRQSRVFVGADASETSFRTNPVVRQARYLHVASHALVDNKHPALSALLLATVPGDEQDGLLQTYEVFELELTADLVVLSACETALGREVRGEGLVGLTRAFLFAGASTVSVSLWPVEDSSTGSLMTAFYRELQRGVPVVEALRRAKLGVAGGSVTSHPYYWASFVLVGAPSAAIG